LTDTSPNTEGSVSAPNLTTDGSQHSGWGSLVYLASPHGHPNPDVREWRFRQVCLAAAELIKADVMPFSPIAHSHPIANLANLHVSWEFWKTFDTAMILRCQELWVLQLPGIRESVGCLAEVEFARTLGTPVVWCAPEDLIPDYDPALAELIYQSGAVPKGVL